jgi:uncharacterized protein (TIGR03435 family)
MFVRMAGAGLLAEGGVEFEVASIKPAQPTARVSSRKFHIGKQVDGARVDIGSMPLAAFLPLAFSVKQYQVSGPAWLSADFMSAERFDIMGKMPEGARQDQVPEMLQALLADRFKLTFHRETDGEVRVTQDGKGRHCHRGGRGGTTRITPGPDRSMHMEASRVTMAQLADALSRFVDRGVGDATELKGQYQVALELSMADLITAARVAGLPGAPPPGSGAASAADAASEPSYGSVFVAVQKLGLRLEPRKTRLETIVIDHLEKNPTEN